MTALPDPPRQTGAPGIACPRCRAPMRSLRLSSHKHQPVSVDHCPDCRLVWFDEFESVQLDGFGWVRLLRELEHGAGRPLAEATVARPACPVCAATLSSVQNRTRFGRFAALECPRRHGHLHSHSGLLAERGLVRPLGQVERRALAQEKHALHCLNCGGPASGGDDNCSYCGTPLVVLDLPRLAHALRLRRDHMGPSPQSMGRHAAWPCRGCGSPLDPGRETHCPSCGHAVVAFQLPDIHPLLDAAEAELAAAATAAAVVDAKRQASNPVRRRSTMDKAQRNGRAGPARPPAPSRWTRALMLAGWSPLLAVLVISASLAALVVADVPLGPRTPLQALRAQPVGDDPSQAWIWAEAHRLLQPTDDLAQRALRQGLFDHHLRQLAGDPWPVGATVGSVIDGSRAQSAAMDSRDSLARLNRALTRHLKLAAPVADEPLPEETSGVRGRLSSAAPGIWVEANSRSAGVWVPTVENTGPSPLLVKSLSARMLVSGQDGVGWNCRPARGADPLLRAGERLLLTCRTQVMVRLQEDLWSAAMHQLRAGESLPLQWQHEGLRSQAALREAIDRLVADAAAGSVPLDRFLRRHTDLRRNTPVVVAAAAATPKRPASAAAMPALSLKARWLELSGTDRFAVVLAGLVGIFAAYCMLARLLGERKATIAWMLVAAPSSYVLGGGEGIASILLVAMFLALAVILALVLVFAFRIYRDAVFSRFD